MLKNILGSIVFTVAVIALVNGAGNVLVNPSTAPNQPRPLQGMHIAEQGTSESPTAPAPTTEMAVEVAATTDPATTATALIKSGQKTFKRKCMSCHTADKGGKHRTGPNLWGVVGRDKGAVDGFRYSDGMKAKGGTWTEEEIDTFITKPRSFIPDTKMTFAGLKDAQDRAEVIAYLKTLTD